MIIQIPAGPLLTNAYLIVDKNDALVIDPSKDSTSVILQKLGCAKLHAILITHGHFDHIWDLKSIKNATSAQILVHKNDALKLEQPDSTLFGFESISSVGADGYLRAGETLIIGKYNFVVLHTPGHTPGGISLYDNKNKILFTGDTLFKNAHGRTDLPGSSHEDLINSLKEISQLPSETIIYPGHGEQTVLKDELHWIEKLISSQTLIVKQQKI